MNLTLRPTSAARLLARLPHQLGHSPQGSLVLVPVAARSMLGALRIDLPGDAGVDRAAELAIGYLRRVPDGVVSIDDGVRLTSTYDFHYPLVDTQGFDERTGSGVLRFGGFVHLFGHLGTMDVTLANPALHLETDAWTLSFNTSREEGTEIRERLFDVPVAPAVLIGGTLSWDGLQPLLTAAGAELFQTNYAVGTAFDPIHVRIPASA